MDDIKERLESLQAWIQEDRALEVVESGVLQIGRQTYLALMCERVPRLGRTFVYALGALPSAYRNRKASAWRFANGIWAMACYWPGQRATEEDIQRFAHTHPLGATFMLSMYTEEEWASLYHASRVGQAAWTPARLACAGV